jgi:hypothetical protein
MSTPSPDIAQLAGSWRLLSHGTTFTDTKERLEIFGQKPDGRMVLTPAGRIMFLFMKPTVSHRRVMQIGPFCSTGWSLIAALFVWMARGVSSRRSIFLETRHGAAISCGCSPLMATA